MSQISSNKFKTPLCEMAFKYGTDKCPQINHSYTPYYFEVFSPIKNSVKKVLEIGIGGHKYLHKIEEFNPILGGSLKMWRDFFPNAMIYGIDIDPGTMISEDRIQTFECSQSDKRQLRGLLKKIGSDIDIVIDDGSHNPRDQIRTCRFLMPRLKKDVIYIIEDAKKMERIRAELSEFDQFVPELDQMTQKRDARYNKLLVIKNK